MADKAPKVSQDRKVAQVEQGRKLIELGKVLIETTQDSPALDAIGDEVFNVRVNLAAIAKQP